MTETPARDALRIADCPACDARIKHTEHCPTPETHNWGCGCPTTHTPRTSLDLDEIADRAASLYEYATLDDAPFQADADQLTGTDVPALLAEIRRLRNQRRTLTPTEYTAAWHAVEGAAGDPGADPSTILTAVLAALGINPPNPRSNHMTDLHLTITPPGPGYWPGRLDIVEALEAADWTGDTDMPLSILRHPTGAVWALSNDHDDSGLDCPNGTVIEFPSGTPTVVVLAACMAATHTP